MAATIGSMRWCSLCQRYLFRLSTHRISLNISRNASNLTVNHKWKLDPAVQSYLENSTNRHRSHPGIMRIRKGQLPQKLRSAISNMMEKYPSKNLEKKVTTFTNYIWSRGRPLEDEEVSERGRILEADIVSKEKLDLDKLTEVELAGAKKRMQQKFIFQMKKQVYHWQPVKYDAYKGFLYMIGRMPQEYSILLQIFSEIAKRNPSFTPSTLFDFGSGVGSGIWAMNEVWKDSLGEHYCVDSSGDMNTLARLLLQDGDPEKEMCFPGVYFRQYMPPSAEKTYDVVLCSFSLMEQHNQKERLNKLYALWQKTEKYLVIVENGTNAGFLNVAEAREFILSLDSIQSFKPEDRERLKGHVFAPCPHDLACGRLARRDGTPCNFTVGYNALLKAKGGKDQKALYSYVVLKKGDKKATPDTTWPRVIRETITPSKRVELKTCCPNAELQISVITNKRHGKDFAWCARNSNWGDLFPVVPAEDESPADSEPTPEHSEQELHLEISETPPPSDRQI